MLCNCLKCGKVYDDARRWTICPHNPLGESPLPKETKMAVFNKPTHADLENRFMHHPPHGDQAARYAAIRGEVCELAKFIVANTPCCPEQSRALNALDEAMFLANASIARYEPKS